MLEHSMELSSRELLARNAELTTANARLGESLSRLGEVQAQLVDTSRLAGMAEVATAVLHNVGNVLNSINVSAALVSEQVRGSKVASLSRAAAMMLDRASDLARFLTEDERGRLLPEYLCRATEAALREQATMLKELESLQKNVDHVKAIVTMQQSHAKSGGIVETLPVIGIVEEALQFEGDSYARHGIAVDLDIDPTLQITTDKHRVLQILINVVSNARQAVKTASVPRARVVVRARTEPPGRVVLDVEDNGVGIPPENLTKIFAHGFTTRADGHGFGLHGSACTALELGGSLTAASDGVGQGARFTLDLLERIRRAGVPTPPIRG